MARLGVNVDPGGNSSPATLDFMRSSWVRAVARPEYDITRWLSDASNGQNVLVVIAHESADGAGLPWDEALRAWNSRYGPYVSAWQLMNEPDAGWDPVDRLSAAQRAASGLYPSSWCMEPGDVSERLRVGRNVLGPDAFIVSPGFSSGHVEFAELCDLSPCNAIACHPYAKTPDTDDLEEMIDGYATLAGTFYSDFKQLWVSEYDSRTQGMHSWMANEGLVSVALAFDLDDRYGPDDFGMIDSDGNIKPSFTAFVQAAKETPMPDYSQWQGQIGTGLLDMMKADNTLPAQRKSTFLPLGTNPSDIEEAHGQNGVLYVWHLDGSGSYRFAPDQ